MAEYIEREALLNALKEERKNGNFVFTSKWIKEIVDNLPTADVAPVAEVASAIFGEIFSCLEYIEEQCERVPDELLAMREDLVFLRAKYTGMDQNETDQVE